jgi:membrane protease YdiL (CAAX protease family)
MNEQQSAASDNKGSSENPYAPSAGAAELSGPFPFPPLSPTKPRVWTVFVALVVMLVAFVAAQIVGAIGLVAWYFAQGGTSDRIGTDLLEFAVQPGPFLLVGSIGQAAIGGVAIAAAWLSPVPLALRLGLVRPRWSAATSAVAIVGSIVPFAIGLAAAYGLAEVLPPDPSVAKMYEAMTPAWALPFLLFISLAPGFCEEMMFRGYVQRRLLERWPAWIAIGFTSLVFAIVHIVPHAVVFAFPLGIWLGMMAWKSGSIWPGIICHASINGLWNVWQLGVRFEIFPEDPPLALLVVLGVAGVTAFGASLRLMFGSTSTSQ